MAVGSVSRFCLLFNDVALESPRLATVCNVCGMVDCSLPSLFQAGMAGNGNLGTRYVFPFSSGVRRAARLGKFAQGMGPLFAGKLVP